ncbi:MAG: alkaline phosphatase family protein [bacterium]|nr:alkaline phosphatase family protein [bacterium]
MSKKIIVIGIDAFDFNQLTLFKENLPNFTKLQKINPDIRMTSVFPPDSIPAWGSIYTGLNPAEHGAINFMDAKDDKSKINFRDLHKYYKGRTFWDKASEQGKKVCIMLPFSIYPPWQVNGVMVCRTLDVVNEDFPLKTYPEDIYEKFGLSDFNVNLFHGFPSKRNLKKYIESMRKRTEAEAKLGLRFLEKYDADLYFIYFSALDAIQHTFWNYYDEKHPDYPGENPYKNIIKDFYVLFDKILGDYLNRIDDDTSVIVISDHGHGMRPVNLVNINEILRLKGYLHPVKKSKIENPFNQKEKIKKSLSNVIATFGLGNFTLKLLSKFTLWKKVLASPSYIDFNRTVAYVSDLSGIKSYSQGGIIINKDVDGVEYENIRNKIIGELKEIIDPKTGRNLMKWIVKREELYEGKYLNRYPDILFELESDYGVGWSIYDSIIGKSSMSSFQPGSHMKDSPIFLVSKLGGIYIKKNILLMDIGDIILELITEIQTEFPTIDFRMK